MIEMLSNKVPISSQKVMKIGMNEAEYRYTEPRAPLAKHRARLTQSDILDNR